MTQEEKDLLLKDLCARLPYHPTLNWKFLDNSSRDEVLKELSDLNMWWITKARDLEVKPYLRPMSSMTEEEAIEYEAFFTYDGIDESCFLDYIDWLNSHHFDYRDLIEKGLALVAPEDMYKN